MKLRRIEPSLRRALRGACRVPSGATVLVAASGGADSTALLIGVDALAHEFGYRVHAAHLHHGLRGVEADGDLAFVRALCRRLGVPLTAARWDVRARMRRRGLSGQAGLRTLRRAFLTAVAARTGAVRIATAHTADDQLETLLLRIARGAGLTGLGAMSGRRGAWVRPLLDVPRAWIEADLRAARQTWREDASNGDLRYARNRVRHQVVPALLEVAGAPGRPAAREAVTRRTALRLLEIRQARRLVQRAAARNAARVRSIQRSEIALDSNLLRSYPSAIRRAVLEQAWRIVPGVRNRLTGRHLEALTRPIMAPREGMRIALPEGREAVLRRGWLVIGASVRDDVPVPGRRDRPGRGNGRPRAGPTP
jgi:tRNA(Ile)-lysidine synthase